ncbi:MAG: hypothetical protein AABX70_08580 [Nanoarchaeota archaeon]
MSTLDDYVAAYDRFRRELLLDDEAKALLDVYKEKGQFLVALHEKVGIEIFGKIFNSLLKTRSTKVLESEKYGLSPELKDQGKAFLVAFRGMARSLKKCIDSRLAQYAFNHSTVDALVTNGLSVTYGVPHGARIGEASSRTNSVVLQRDIASNHHDLTLVHECGHLFYNIFSPSRSVECLARYSPIEVSLDSMAAEALNRDPKLGDYILAQVKAVGRLNGSRIKA